jgi:hypothetical protein
MTNTPWAREFPGAIPVCNTAGMILEMNDLAVRAFEKQGGHDLVGSNLPDCHPELSRSKVRDDRSLDGGNEPVGATLGRPLGGMRDGFHPVQGKQRTLNKVQGGVVTFADAPPPIEICGSPTTYRKLKDPATSDRTGPGEQLWPSPPRMYC